MFWIITPGPSIVLQAGILAVGRGNKVVEAVIGLDGKTVTFLWVFDLWLLV